MENSPKVIKFIYLRIFIASIVLGIAYGVVSHLNPFVYVNVVFLAVIIGLLLFLMTHAIQHGKIKSKTVYFMFGIITCTIVWLMSWAVYYTFDTENGVVKIFTAPAKFVEYIIEYAHKNKFSIGKGSSKIRMDRSVMAILYIAEFMVFLLPALVAFRKPKSNTNLPTSI